MTSFDPMYNSENFSAKTNKKLGRRIRYELPDNCLISEAKKIN